MNNHGRAGSPTPGSLFPEHRRPAPSSYNRSGREGQGRVFPILSRERFLPMIPLADRSGRLGFEAEEGLGFLVEPAACRPNGENQRTAGGEKCCPVCSPGSAWPDGSEPGMMSNNQQGVSPQYRLKPAQPPSQGAGQLGGRGAPKVLFILLVTRDLHNITLHQASLFTGADELVDDTWHERCFS